MNSESIRILIAEDDPIIAEPICKLTGRFTDHCTLVASGAEACEIIAGERPDIVLLDYFLSDINAIDILKSVNARNRPDCLFVVQSANTEHEIVQACLEYGAHDYIRKPYSFIEFELKLRNYIDTITQRKELSRMKSQVEKERDILKKYFPKDFSDALLSGEISTEIGGRLQTASTLICDLRDSTRMAEEVQPEELAHFLSDFFADLADLVFGQGGSITAFRGDGFLATFGVPHVGREDVLNCARAALRIRAHLNTFNSFRPSFLKEPIRIGMGIATGRVFVGNVGSVHRLDYTVLGDPVNLAARLEALTKRANVDLFIDGSTRDTLGARAQVRPVQLTHVRGKKESVRVYHLTDLDD